MIHLCRLHHFDFPVFTLDTGLLFPETVALKKTLEDFFGINIESIEPELTVQGQVDTYGAELWNHDPDLCCTLRKVLPLQDKLTQVNCWITGLRRQQSGPQRIGIRGTARIADGGDMIDVDAEAELHDAVSRAFLTMSKILVRWAGVKA